MRSGSSQTCVDVVGQPAVNVVDFFGQTGASYVTGAAGKYFALFDQVSNQFNPWFTTGTESDPNTGFFEVVTVITTLSQPSDIAAALAAAWNLAFPTTATATVINGGGTNSAVRFTLVVDGNAQPTVDFNTGATFSNPQLGYPSAHICSPTSDAMAGIPNIIIRPQANFLGVGTISGLGPGYTPTNPFASNGAVLFQDSALTTPANQQGQTVEGNADLTSGLSIIQSNSMNAPILDFIQGANGMQYPTLLFNGTSNSLATAGNIGISGASARTVFFVAKLNSTATDQCLFGWGAASSANAFFAITFSGKWYFNGYSADVNSNVSIDTDWHVHCVSFDGTNVNWQIDGLTPLTNFPAAVALNTTNGPLQVGDEQPVIARPLNANVASGPLVIAGTLTDPQKTTIFNYLAQFIP